MSKTFRYKVLKIYKNSRDGDALSAGEFEPPEGWRIVSCVPGPESVVEYMSVVNKDTFTLLLEQEITEP